MAVNERPHYLNPHRSRGQVNVAAPLEPAARALERELMAAMAVNSNLHSVYGAAGIAG